tara:strand:- start:45 stop:317 length:273 start_codon:yes stop_codon:yes gene_type:complete
VAAGCVSRVLSPTLVVTQLRFLTKVASVHLLLVEFWNGFPAETAVVIILFFDRIDVKIYYLCLILRWFIIVSNLKFKIKSWNPNLSVYFK